MPSLPIGKNHHSRALLANHTRNLQAVLPCVLYAAVGDVERLPPGNSQNLRGLDCFPRPVFGGAAGSHLALRQVENAGAMTAFGHLEQSSTAGLFNIITMSGDCENLDFG